MSRVIEGNSNTNESNRPQCFDSIYSFTSCASAKMRIYPPAPTKIRNLAREYALRRCVCTAFANRMQPQNGEPWRQPEKEDERRTTNRSTKQRSRQITWLISIVVDVLWLPVASLDKGFSVKFTSIYSHIHRSGTWLPHTPRNNPLAIMSVNRQIFDEARPDVLWFQYVRISIVLKMPCCCGRCGARIKKWIWRENQVMASDWYVICFSS